jgi:hypothetical protein
LVEVTHWDASSEGLWWAWWVAQKRNAAQAALAHLTAPNLHFAEYLDLWQT